MDSMHRTLQSIESTDLYGIQPALASQSRVLSLCWTGRADSQTATHPAFHTTQPVVVSSNLAVLSAVRLSFSDQQQQQDDSGARK